MSPTPVPRPLYEPLARCLHEYQLSVEQERDLKNDAAFQSWYVAQTRATHTDKAAP